MFQMLLRVVGSIIFRYTLEEVNNVPKYEEIANILRERIRSKEYPPDSFLPNQVDLVKEFGASRMTIKKSHQYLSDGRTCLFAARIRNENLESSIYAKRHIAR